MAQSRYSQVDEYGFQRPANFNYESYNNFMMTYMAVLTRRSIRWNSIKNLKHTRSKTLKRFIRKGIPSDSRAAVWMVVSGAEELKNSSQFTYQDFKKKINNPTIIESIQIDLPRTFPDNIYFTNQGYLPQLFNILGAFAHQNEEVGYCQGLNYIAGLLLLSTKSEETSFWLLKTLVDKILPNYFVANMNGLITDLDVLSEIVKKTEPDVHHHLQILGMPWALGTTKWFICLYAEVLPAETVLRIWDCLFNEGSKIIFRVAVTLIKLHKSKILEATELGELISCFKSMPNHEHVINCHQFMEDIFKFPGNFSRTSLEKLRREFRK